MYERCLMDEYANIGHILNLERLCVLDRSDKQCYNYIVIDYGVIIESEAIKWHSETIHLMIRS